MKLKAWNRFLTRGLYVCPELMGCAHEFQFEGVQIRVQLPPVDVADRGPESDEVAKVGSRLAANSQPLEYEILKADVVSDADRSIDVDAAVLKRHPNAFDLVPEEQQEVLNQTSRELGALAAGAFRYWILILRWVTDDYRIGKSEFVGPATGWGTCLQETASGTRVWLEPGVWHAPGHHRLTVKDWTEAQDKRKLQSSVPIHLTLKFEAEEFLANGDVRRSLIDTCIACETFIRSAVLASLPLTLDTHVRRFLDEGNISQYIAHFFPRLLNHEEATRYEKSIRPELRSLVDKRNKIMHNGDTSGATLENCVRFLGTARSLFALTRSTGALGPDIF